MIEIPPTILALLVLAVAAIAAAWTAAMLYLAYRMGLSAGYRKSRDMPPAPPLPMPDPITKPLGFDDEFEFGGLPNNDEILPVSASI